MDIVEPLHNFQFDNYQTFYQQISQVVSDDDSVISDANRRLLQYFQPALSQLVSKRILINFL